MMQNISDSCRICLKFTESPVLLINRPENYSKDYLTLIKECVPTLEISYDDMMPKQICDSCANEVLVSYRFRKRAISSEKIVQNMFKRQEEQEIPVQTKDIESSKSAVASTTTPIIGSCGNFCDQCINTGCLSMTIPIELPKAENETILTRKTETPCRFCGSDQASCNICNLDLDEKPDITNVDVISISPTENLEDEIRIDPIIEETTSQNNTILPETTNTYQCSECEKKFVTKSRLKKHIMTHSPEKPYHCKHCKWSFATNAELETHTLVNHNTVGRNECVYCQKTFKEKRLLRQHMITHKQQKRFICKYCKKGFNLLHHLKNHEKIHENKSEYECEICFKKFLTKDRLLSHIKIHGEKKHRCSICNKGFISASQLAQHELSHQSETSFVCSSCGLQFNEKSKFDRHRKGNCMENNNLIENDTSRTKSICLVCNLAFDTVQELKRHMKIHTNAHVCPTCNKSFLQLNTLENHMKTHTPRSFLCSHCNESFSRQDHLKSHVARKHSEVDEKDYKYSCTECGKRFLQSGELTIHLRTHSNSRPFNCAICSKSFNQLNQLKAHERLHSNQKPYICKVCDKAYHSASGLEQHLKSSHTKVVTVEREITLSLQDITPEELEQASIITFDMNLP